MASLTIRNVTANPLELMSIERFQETPKYGPLARLCQALTRLFVSYDAIKPLPIEDQEPYERQDGRCVLIEPFETKRTEVRPADVGREVLRLTFRSPGTDHLYLVDCPGPGSRSQVMRKLGSGPLELTVIYTASGGQLTIFSSAELASWMSELRDEYSLSALSIPGTHNSPTCYVALPSVRCQAVSVREQLDNGVRFLDIRVSVHKHNDDLPLVHSVFPISLTGNKYLSDLLQEVYAFLDTNPSETVLMSIKREGTGRGTDQKLSTYLHSRYCSGDNAKSWFTEPRIPSLGEARGKIVLIRRFNIDDLLWSEHEGKGWGLDASAWPDNCMDEPTGSGLLRIQDFYEVGQSNNIERKIDMARCHLEKACQRKFATPTGPDASSAEGPLPFFINFLSASNFFNASCWPENIAAKINPSIIEYLCVGHAEQGQGPAQLEIGDAGTGIVVTDWVGQHGDWDLLRCIVGWNARLQVNRHNNTNLQRSLLDDEQ